MAKKKVRKTKRKAIRKKATHKSNVTTLEIILSIVVVIFVFSLVGILNFDSVADEASKSMGIEVEIKETSTNIPESDVVVERVGQSDRESLPKFSGEQEPETQPPIEESGPITSNNGTTLSPAMSGFEVSQ